MSARYPLSLPTMRRTSLPNRVHALLEDVDPQPWSATAIGALLDAEPAEVELVLRLNPIWFVSELGADAVEYWRLRRTSDVPLWHPEDPVAFIPRRMPARDEGFNWPLAIIVVAGVAFWAALLVRLCS